MKPSGVWADLFRARYRLACRRAGIGRGSGTGIDKEDFTLDCSQFRRPESSNQLRLL
jgi:hypothetical protein